MLNFFTHDVITKTSVECDASTFITNNEPKKCNSLLFFKGTEYRYLTDTAVHENSVLPVVSELCLHLAEVSHSEVFPLMRINLTSLRTDEEQNIS